MDLMTTVTIRELCDQRGEVVDRAARGEQITITRSGRPVAELLPLRPPRAPLSADSLLERWRRLPAVDPVALREDVDDLVERANKSMYGLAAGVWTRDISKAHAIANSVRAGTVWVNCYDVFDAAAPFGGFKQSGIGRELGEYGLQQYTEVKTVTVKL